MDETGLKYSFAVKIFSSVAEIGEFCAEGMKGPRVAISGGSTFKALFENWRHKSRLGNLKYFPVDERRVPFEDPANNWGVAVREFFEPIGSGGQIKQLAESKKQYEKLLVAEFSGDPIFDEIYLGMGDDGHTASLFPGGPELLDEESWVLETISPKAPFDRVTLGLKTLWSCRKLRLIATGDTKAPMVKRLLSGDETLPATLALKGHSSPLVILDKGAAAQLTD